MTSPVLYQIHVVLILSKILEYSRYLEWLFVWLSVCLCSINTKKAEQIGSKFSGPVHITQWKVYGLSKWKKIARKKMYKFWKCTYINRKTREKSSFYICEVLSLEEQRWCKMTWKRSILEGTFTQQLLDYKKRTIVVILSDFPFKEVYLKILSIWRPF